MAEKKARLYTIGYASGSVYAVRAFNLNGALRAVQKQQLSYARPMTADEAFDCAKQGREVLDGVSEAPTE